MALTVASMRSKVADLQVRSRAWWGSRNPFEPAFCVDYPRACRRAQRERALQLKIDARKLRQVLHSERFNRFAAEAAACIILGFLPANAGFPIPWHTHWRTMWQHDGIVGDPICIDRMMISLERGRRSS